MSAPPSPTPVETVSRGAFFGGILLGLSIAALGFYWVETLDLATWASALLELAFAAAALGAVKLVWRTSVRLHALDSEPGGNEPRGTDEGH